MTNWHDFRTDPKRFMRLVSFKWKRPNTLRRPLCQLSIRRSMAVCWSSVYPLMSSPALRCKLVFTAMAIGMTSAAVASLCKGSFICAFVGKSDRPMWSACSAASEHWTWGGYRMYPCLLKTRRSQTSTAGLSLWHAGMRLPGVSVIEAPRSVQGCLWCLLVLHLQSVRRNVNRNDGLICSHILSTRTMCFSRLTVNRYRSGRIGIGGDTQTDISYSPIL